MAPIESRSDSLFRSLLNSTVRVSQGGRGEFIGWLAPFLVRELRGLCQLGDLALVQFLAVLA
jgi:hypothetical protein